MVLKAKSQAITQSDIRQYLYYVLSTGTFKTFRAWRNAGGVNPFGNKDYRSDMVTRSEIANMFHDPHHI